MHPCVGDVHPALCRQFSGLTVNFCLTRDNAVSVDEGWRVKEFCQACDANLLQIQRPVKRSGSRICRDNRSALALQPNLLRSLTGEMGRCIQGNQPMGSEILQGDIDVVIHRSRLLRLHIGESELPVAYDQFA